MGSKGQEAENSLDLLEQDAHTLKSQGGLGFKKPNTFNLALLAKKGWRIHQQENSL